jgi:hypothetical protein
LDQINKSEAVIWCGGPGYASDFYPRVLPLVKNPSDIKVPIVPMGLGWAVGEKGEAVNAFRFSQESMGLLQEIHSRIPYSSVRDILTEQVLNNVGIDNVVTTGCAAWYHLPTVNDDFVPPVGIKQIVVTTPAQSKNFKETAQVVQLIGRMFPQATRYLVFHRGIYPGRKMRLRSALDNTLLARAGHKAGFQIVDASYSTEKIQFYEMCDLHVGYRVHAHIDFLSLRIPSILVQEDARGLGQSMTLGTKDVRAGGANVVDSIQSLIEEHQDTSFEAFHATVKTMQSKHEIMREFIHSF